MFDLVQSTPMFLYSPCKLISCVTSADRTLVAVASQLNHISDINIRTFIGSDPTDGKNKALNMILGHLKVSYC